MGHMSHYYRNPRWPPKLSTAAGNVVYISMYKHDKVEMCLVCGHIRGHRIQIYIYVDIEFKFMNSK